MHVLNLDVITLFQSARVIEVDYLVTRTMAVSVDVIDA
jgi:hypothetical protein